MPDVGRINTVPPGERRFSGRWGKCHAVFGVCVAVFFSCLAVVLLNFDTLKRPVFQRKTDISAPSSAKYEKDGNLYIIDNAGFRLISMTVDGNVNYTVNIDKMKEYSRF
ncbi:MAG: hypothetical protein LBP32_09250, partial [Spirochaetaceae bacterium]|nr:hypothetical protein [Spirochaetaceae bacterium]